MLMILQANKLAIDGGHSLGQVMKFAGHRNPKTLVGHYLDNMSNVDGAAALPRPGTAARSHTGSNNVMDNSRSDKTILELELASLEGRMSVYLY